MLRSMYSAISGMDSFQTKLDVIANNISNVNTTGFKSGRVNFADVLSQTVSGASTGSTTLGGTNPVQVGLGTKVAGIQTLFTQGADQSTGNPLDVAINGDGMFVLRDGSSNAYSRAGSFATDDIGGHQYLVAPNGMLVQGYAVPTTSGTPDTSHLVDLDLTSLTSSLQQAPASTGGVSTPLNLTLSTAPNVQIGPDGSVSVTASDGKQYTVGVVALATFPNYAGLSHSGDNNFVQSANSGSPQLGKPGNNNVGSLQSGFLEMSNVDLTRQFTEMIVAQRGFDANSKMIGTDNAILNDIVNLKNG